MLYILGILITLLVLNVLLLKFSCNGCEKISDKTKTFSYKKQSRSISSQHQVAFDK